MTWENFIPAHPLVLPVAVFGFLSCAWLLVLAISASRGEDAADGSRERGTRVLRTWIDGKETEIRVPSTRRAPTRSGIARLLIRSGLRVSPRAFVSHTALLLSSSFILALFWSRSLVVSTGVLMVLAAVVLLFLRYRASQRRDLLDRQCVDALRIASRSLSAGHPISGVIQVLSTRMSSPTGGLFVEIVQREEMGESLASAIRTVLLNAETCELRAFGTALLVQIEAGGKLTDAIDRLCSSIVERMILRKRGEALTAASRFSARFIMLVPFGCVLVFSINSSFYADFMFKDPLGRLMLVGSLLLLLAGLLAVNKLSRIDYGRTEVPR